MNAFINTISGSELDETEYIQKWLLKVKIIHDGEQAYSYNKRWFRSCKYV